MNLWQLNVIDLESPDWIASTYKGDCIVRAPDERSARREAQFRFQIAVEKKLGESKANPWCQGALVSCEPYTGKDYLLVRVENYPENIASAR